MESIISRIFVHNWQRKLVAVLTAIVIWLFVNHSISETKTLSNIPIRIINLPSDKTIQGLLPNGMLSRRITLTLSGSKDVIDDLEPGDLEVLLDASTADNDEWIVQISKKNLVSLNPSIDLFQHINQVDHTDFVIKLSRLVTAKIPVHIESPKGTPPQGYEYLDIWPQHFFQVVSGPEEEIQQLKDNGLELTFDLNDISKSDLETIKSSNHNDEISFIVPKKWKQIVIPFRNNSSEEPNDPEAQNLRIDFLRKEFLPIEKEIPIRIFYPLEDLDKINPETISLAYSGDIQEKNGISIFTRPLFAKEVSRLFIDVIRNSIEIVIVAAPKSKREILAWSLQFVNPHDLEDTYVAFSIANSSINKGNIPKKKEELLRKRFRDYMQRLTLYLEETKKLHLKSTIEGNQIRVIAY
jgi:YbbR domain-containing protein